MDADHIGGLAATIRAKRRRQKLAVLLTQVGDECAEQLIARKSVDDVVDHFVKSMPVRLVGQHALQDSGNFVWRPRVLMKTATHEASRDRSWRLFTEHFDGIAGSLRN